MSSLWNFKYSFFMFADSFLDSLFPGSLRYSALHPSLMSLSNKNINFYSVLTACHFLPRILTERRWSCNISKIERICFLILLNKLESINNSGTWDSTEVWNPFLFMPLSSQCNFFYPLFKGSLSEKSFPVWKELGG